MTMTVKRLGKGIAAAEKSITAQCCCVASGQIQAPCHDRATLFMQLQSKNYGKDILNSLFCMPKCGS